MWFLARKIRFQNWFPFPKTSNKFVEDQLVRHFQEIRRLKLWEIFVSLKQIQVGRVWDSISRWSHRQMQSIIKLSGQLNIRQSHLSSIRLKVQFNTRQSHRLSTRLKHQSNHQTITLSVALQLAKLLKASLLEDMQQAVENGENDNQRRFVGKSLFWELFFQALVDCNLQEFSWKLKLHLRRFLDFARLHFDCEFTSLNMLLS